MTPTRTLRPSRRLRHAATLFAAVLVITGLAPLAGGQSGFVNGSGNAKAQLMRFGPTAGRLSLSPTYGLSLADFLSTLGRGEAATADWAALGVAEPALEEETPRIKVESTDENSEEGVTDNTGGSPPGSPFAGGNTTLFARATDAPFGESSATMSNFGTPVLIEFKGGTAKTTSGIVAPGQRESTAIVEFQEINFGGVAKMTGLKWTAIQRTGAKNQIITTFTMDGASTTPGIFEIPIPIPSDGEYAPVFDEINGVVGSFLGINIIPPVTSKAGDNASVSPMGITIDNSSDTSLARLALGSILDGIQPIREPLFDAIIEGSDGEAALGVLLADIFLGILSGSSQFHVQLGGASAFTEGQVFVSPFGGPIAPPVRPGGTETIVIPGEPGTPASTSDDTGDIPLTAGPVSGPLTETVPGGKTGVAVGLAGLGLIAALGTRDYWLMRRRRWAEAEAEAAAEGGA